MSAKTRSKGKKQELASSSTMEDAQEIKQLITDLKCSISGEIQEFRKEFKNFRQQTETDIKTRKQAAAGKCGSPGKKNNRAGK